MRSKANAMSIADRRKIKLAVAIAAETDGFSAGLISGSPAKSRPRPGERPADCMACIVDCMLEAVCRCRLAMRVFWFSLGAAVIVVAWVLLTLLCAVKAVIERQDLD